VTEFNHTGVRLAGGTPARATETGAPNFNRIVPAKGRLCHARPAPEQDTSPMAANILCPIHN
jgi:hypothetical protein